MTKAYIHYYNQGIFNEKTEYGLLFQIAQKQASEILFEYLVTKYHNLNPLIIVQLIFDIHYGNKYQNNDYPEIKKYIIFTLQLINIIFSDHKIHEYTIINIPDNLDVSFIRCLLFDYGLRIRIMDNQLHITWKKVYNESQNYPNDLLSENKIIAFNQLKRGWF